MTRFLEAFTSRDCSREIQGNTVISGTEFLRYFETYIKDVDVRNNNCDSFADAIDWAFNKWSKEAQALGFKNAKNITQEMITSGNADYKKHEPMIARWVNLYNVYCNKGLTISGRQTTAIPLENNKDTKNRWNKFLIESNALVRGSLEDTAKQGLKFM